MLCQVYLIETCIEFSHFWTFRFRKLLQGCSIYHLTWKILVKNNKNSTTIIKHEPTLVLTHYGLNSTLLKAKVNSNILSSNPQTAAST